MRNLMTGIGESTGHRIHLELILFARRWVVGCSRKGSLKETVQHYLMSYGDVRSPLP